MTGIYLGAHLRWRGVYICLYTVIGDAHLYHGYTVLT